MKNPIAKYLMCAFAYYQLDTNLIPDSEFDQLAKDILADYDNIEHMHKHLVTKKDEEYGKPVGTPISEQRIKECLDNCSSM